MQYPVVDPDVLEERYLDRIHGAGIFRQGLTVSPVCTTCHGAHGVLPPTDENSLIHKDKVNDGCAKCHTNKERVHEGIVAPELWSRAGAVPICVDCHQPHLVRKVTYQTNMSNAECLECHGNS
ncbi:MAG: cytochrome c3 family protein, partial [Myxococcota bacterium]